MRLSNIDLQNLDMDSDYFLGVDNFEKVRTTKTKSYDEVKETSTMKRKASKRVVNDMYEFQEMQYA